VALAFLRRIAGVGTLLLVFAGCAPALAPQGFENAAPAIETDTFVTRDGLHLPLREWDSKSPKAVIVALHGMSDYSEAFEMPASPQSPMTSAVSAARPIPDSGVVRMRCAPISWIA